MRDEVRNPTVSYAECLIEATKSDSACKDDFKQLANLLVDREDRTEAKHAKHYLEKAYTYIVKKQEGQSETEERICKHEDRTQICQDAIQILIDAFAEHQVDEAENSTPEEVEVNLAGDTSAESEV